MITQPIKARTDVERLLDSGQLAAAEEIVIASGGHERDPDAAHILGFIRLQQNRFDEALSFLRHSLTLRPGHPDVLLNLAKTLRAVNCRKEAFDLLIELATAQPALVEAWVELGMLALQSGEPAAAQDYLHRALQWKPSHLLARLWLGIALHDRGQDEAAECVLAEGLIVANSADIRGAFAYNLAQAQYAQGKMEGALENYAIADLADPELNASINRAEILEELFRFTEAEAELEELIRRMPENAAAHEAYNNLLYRLKRSEKFLSSFNQAPQTKPLKIIQASLLLNAGQQGKAYELFADIIARDNGDLKAALGAASALNELGRPLEAVHHLERALAYHPENAALFRNLAASALQGRDPQKAAAMAEECLRRSPFDQAGLAVLGSAWRAMGDMRDETLNGYGELIQVFDLRAPDGFSSMTDFNHELSNWLEGRHPQTGEPLQQSLRGGSQTRGHMFGQRHDLVERLRTCVEAALSRFIAGITPDAQHPFRCRRERGFRFTGSWSSRLTNQGYHVNHVHPGGWISSCYYVAVPNVVNEGGGTQGWIKFGEPSFDVGLGARLAVQPKPGRLVLFPSYMWHGTVPFHERSSRITIAFDAVPQP